MKNSSIVLYFISIPTEPLGFIAVSCLLFIAVFPSHFPHSEDKLQEVTPLRPHSFALSPLFPHAELHF